MKQNSTRTYIAAALIIHGEDVAEKLSKTLFYLNKDIFYRIHKNHFTARSVKAYYFRQEPVITHRNSQGIKNS